MTDGIAARSQPEPRGARWSTLALLAILALLWGTNWPAMKIVLAEIPVLTFRSLCLGTSGILFLLLARLGGERIFVTRREWPALLFVSFFNVTIWYLFTAIGITLIPAGRAALLAYTFPVWVALISAVVLRERLGLRRLAGLALGMIGIAVLIAPDLAALQAAPLGTLSVIVAALGWAIGTVGLKFFRFSQSVAQLAGWQLVIGGAPIAIAAVLHDPAPHLLALDTRTLWVLVYILSLPMSLGQWAWFKSLSQLSGTVTAIGSLAVPAVGLVSSALLLGEGLGIGEVSALVLMMLALGLVLPPQPARPALRHKTPQ
ncbi:MAG: DMT family transporter [Alphaproteobacteria bacterium]|nr:DMT family transporter [Alphaproteobacteria bacterium]